MDRDDPRRVAAISAAAARLRIDHAGAKAIGALEAAGIPSLILKGPSIARWLYEPEDARSYADCDLLVPPHAFDSAVRALTGVGFEPELEESRMPSWWREHALTTWRTRDGAMVDLHRSIPGVEVNAERLWLTLSADAETVTVGEVTARTLAKPGRVMHAALHAAQHGGSARDLDVLARALDRVDEDTWRAAAALASTLRAEDAFTQGLSMLPAGAALADRLGLPPVTAVAVRLRAERAVEALSVERFHRTRGVRARASFVRHKVVPPPTFMRKWSPLARRGRAGLLLAYLYRPIWILRRSPAALRAWNDAQRPAATPVPRAGGRADGASAPSGGGPTPGDR